MLEVAWSLSYAIELLELKWNVEDRQCLCSLFFNVFDFQVEIS